MSEKDPSPSSPPHPDLDEPVLILSCYRTGSTLLRYILDTHPEIYGPPELFVGEAAVWLGHVAAGLEGGRFDPNQPESLSAEALSWVRATLSERLRAATVRKGKRIWCEKTPSNLAPPNLGLLRRMFPDARKVCLHRHCLDMVQSLLKMIHWLLELHPFLLASQGNAVAAAIAYWNERTTTLLQVEREEPARCFRLRYEDMTRQPAATLEPMFRFLEVDWDAALVDAVFTSQHDQGMQDHSIVLASAIHSGNIGNGRGLPLEGVPETTLVSMRSLLQELGYSAIPVADSPAGSPEAAAAPVRDIRWFFETHLPARIVAEPSLCASFGTLYQFVVGGDAGGAWVVDPRNGQVSVGRSSAVCNVEVSATDLFAIARGNLQPYKAAEQGRLRLRGDIRLPDLEKLVRLFQLPPPSA